jgi:hypothetical protein
VRKPHRVACAVAFALVVIGIVGVIGGCGLPQSKKPFQDPFFDEEDGSNALVSGDMDKDETQWRKELHHQVGPATQNDSAKTDAAKTDPTQDDPLLKDDPPKAPDQYGTVTSHDAPPKDQVADARHSRDPYSVVDDDPEADEKDKTPPTFWQSVGRASFAAFTVLITLGMMAAPYLMMI